MLEKTTIEFRWSVVRVSVVNANFLTITLFLDIDRALEILQETYTMSESCR